MELGRYLTVRRRQNAHNHHEEAPREDHLERRRLPLIDSPVNKQLYDVLDSDGALNLDKMRSRASDLPAISSTDGPILYKTHHEASTIELFYDLFFVANLATFTAAHKHSDPECKYTARVLPTSSHMFGSCGGVSWLLHIAMVHMVEHNIIRCPFRHRFHN